MSLFVGGRMNDVMRRRRRAMAAHRQGWRGKRKQQQEGKEAAQHQAPLIVPATPQALCP